MALVVADRARDTTTTTGTGTVTLSGTAPSGYQNFSVIGNGNTTYYTIVGGSEWEVGTGTYASSGPTLARTTVLASSNGGSAVSFSSGTKDVFVTYPAEIATMLGNSATGTGSVVLSASPTLTGTLTAAAGAFSSTLTSTAHTVTSASATALAVGLNGATNSAFTVDSSTGLQVAGLKVTGAVTGGTVAVVATDSGSATNLTVNAKGTGTIGIGSVSTGAVTITPATTLSAALTYGGITLSNAVTGTGNMVLSASPTLTGTLTAATITASGQIVTTEATGASSTTTGSIHTAGGLGVVGTSWFGANMKLSKTGSAQFIINGTTEGIVLFQNAGTSLWELSSNLTSDYIGIYSYTKGATCLRVDNDGKVNAIYALAVGGAATFASTIASGAITSTGAVTGTYFTPTATGNNGLGLAASGKPAIYAAGTSEIMRFDFADTTAYMVGIGGAPVKITTNIATLQVYGASSGGGFRFGRDSTKEGCIYHDGTNILFQSYTPSLGTFLTITGSTGAATFASTIASGAITSSGIVSGSQLRLDNATFTRVATPDGGGGFAGGYNVTYSSGVKHDSTGSAAGFYYSSSTGVTLYAAASQSAGTALTPVATFAQGGAATFASTIASGAITSTGSSTIGAAAGTGLTLGTGSDTGNNRHFLKFVNGGYAAAVAPGSVSDGDKVIFYDPGSSYRTLIGIDGNANMYLQSGSAFFWYTGATPTVSMRLKTTGLGIGIDPSTQLELSTDSAQKPSTNTWSITSDERIKHNVSNFTDGLSVVKQITPKWYEYNGRGSTKNQDGERHIGIIAQELAPVAPYMVRVGKGVLDGEVVEDIHAYEGHALAFVLVNAIKELTTRLEALENAK